MDINGRTDVSDLCGKCKNIDICKYVLTDSTVLDNLRIGDGSGPFMVSINCKYRDVGSYSNTRALNACLAANYGE